MDCEQCRAALSARLDGEDPGLPGPALDAHLAGCAACRRFAERIGGLAAALPRDAAQVPDRAVEILAAVRVQRRAQAPAESRERVVRAGLAVVGVVQIAAALIGMTAPGAHTLRDLGAFEVALAIGFLVAAVRPSTAAGLLPTAAALAVCLLVVVVADVLGGQAAAGGEAAHVTELVGVTLVWMLARGRPAAQLRSA